MAPQIAPALRIPPQPKLPQVVLYDQYNNAGANATSSQDFEAAFDPFDDELADDFVVPGGQSWSVESIDADGVYFNGTGPAASFNVSFLHEQRGTFPARWSRPASPRHTCRGAAPLASPSARQSLSVPGRTGSRSGRGWTLLGGQWGWTDRTVQSNGSAAWQNPGGGFGVCPLGSKTTCIIDPGVPDQVYRLNGTIGGGTPTPTPTPGGCS